MYTERSAGRPVVVAVVGGGASGTLACGYLLREAAAAGLPLRIIFIDRFARHGLGQAYATEHPGHLLNAPAGLMSAYADDPADLIRWAMANGIQHDGFLPRAAYGRYLREVLASAESEARPESTVTRLSAHVVGLDIAEDPGRPSLRLAGGGRIEADAVVLATGHRPPGPPPCPVPATGRYVADPWAPDALDRITDGSPVVVVGTGLTMLDIAITVTAANPAARVLAVSQHGLLPRAHPATALSSGPHDASGVAGVASAGLTRLIRAVRTAAAGEPGGWEAAVDGIRQQVPDLWQGLSPSDRRLFLRRVSRYWEIHRHRMPPATARRITQLISDGRLAVLSGRVAEVDEVPGGMEITIDSRTGRMTHSAGWLVNATGPAGEINANADPLLRELLTSGLAAADPLQLGITADADGALLGAEGHASDRLFTLGPPLRGQLYESTAIAEIREQAARLAKRLVAGGSVALATDSAVADIAVADVAAAENAA